MTNPTIESLHAEYMRLWATMKVTNPHQVDAIVAQIMKDKTRYQVVQSLTGVPWYVVAALHNRESSRNFKTQLAQGDSLSKKSVNIPRGRGPFGTWEEGAYDALVTLKGLNKIKDWDNPARICYECERYNGFGYRLYHKNVLAPYLWSYSNHYTRGKYVSDGKFSSTAVDQQCGVIPLIKRLMELELQSNGLPEVKPEVKPAPFSEPVKVTPEVTAPKALSLMDKIKRLFNVQ